MITGSSPRSAKKITLPGQSSAICATSGSLALSTAVPSAETASTIVRLTIASLSRVSMSEMPRWSPSPMFVTTATSQRSKPKPARKMPPRAVSSTAASTFGFISTGLRTQRSAAVAGLDATLVDEDAVGARHAHFVAERPHDVSDEPRGRCLAIHASHGHDRNVAALTFAKQAVDDRFAHRARLAGGRLQMHSQSGARVHLDDHAPLAFQRTRNVIDHHVDSSDVEPDHLGGLDRASGDLRMNQVGHVGRGAAGAQVGVAPHEHARPQRRHALGREALFRQHGQRDLVEANLGQHGRVVVAARGSRFTTSTNCVTVERPSPITCAGSRLAAATILPPMTRMR